MLISVEGIGRPIEPLKSVAERIDARGRRGLGQTPRLRQHVARDFLPVLGHRALHGHAAAERDAQLR